MDDARGNSRLISSLRNLGTDKTHINMILDMAVRKGDILRLDLTVPNTGPGGGNNPTDLGNGWASPGDDVDAVLL